MKRYIAVLSVLAVFALGAVATRHAIREHRTVVTVVHWSNSHLMRDGLLPAMAKKFNSERHMTASGGMIRVIVVNCDSAVQVRDLTQRLKGAGKAEAGCTTAKGAPADNPAIVTPQSDDWLVDLNANLGRQVVDRAVAPHIAETWLGVVTYGAVAECLGWKDHATSYREILALVTDNGWGVHSDCAKSDWGSPKLAFTNPSTSTSGRNVLVSLYAMAARTTPAKMTLADVQRPEVVRLVQQFAGAVDHYMPGTIPLNTKIAQGKQYGQFFLMPEDNLVSLAQGTERAIAADGTEQKMAPVDDLVMLYPKEGSVLNSNPAAMIDAPWVSLDQSTGAHLWIDFLRSQSQQRKFMQHGFRPGAGTNMAVDAEQFAEWGLDARPPSTTIDPGELAPAVLRKIVDSWGVVKNQAVVTFLVDVSLSMNDNKRLDAVKLGLGRLVDALSVHPTDLVGLITFSDENNVLDLVAPTPIRDAKAKLGDAIGTMSADGGTALYSAIAHAVEVTDRAVADPGATRAVVVLTDGAANEGMCLTDLVRMTSREVDDVSLCAKEDDSAAVDSSGDEVDPKKVIGVELRDKPVNPVQVFFIGFGKSDVNAGRILARATGADYRGKTDQALASVIENLKGYF